MKRVPISKLLMSFLLLIILLITLPACILKKPSFPKGNVETLAATAMDLPPQPAKLTVQPGALPKKTATLVKTHTQPAKFTLEIETFGTETVEGLTMTHGPFNISIPLESNPNGLKGHGKGLLKEICTGVVTGERTSEINLDVTATGHDPLTFSIVSTSTFVEETGLCFISIPKTAVKIESIVELPARDGASKKLDHPTDIGTGYELYTLRIE